MEVGEPACWSAALMANNLYAMLPKSDAPLANTQRRLAILTRAWQVIFVDGQLFHNNTNVDGLCDATVYVITISGAQSRDNQRTSLVHEVCHAIDFTHSNGNIDGHEAHARAGELGWYTILRDSRNDWFVNFIREGRNAR